MYRLLFIAGSWTRFNKQQEVAEPDRRSSTASTGNTNLAVFLLLCQIRDINARNTNLAVSISSARLGISTPGKLTWQYPLALLDQVYQSQKYLPGSISQLCYIRDIKARNTNLTVSIGSAISEISTLGILTWQYPSALLDQGYQRWEY